MSSTEVYCFCNHILSIYLLERMKTSLCNPLLVICVFYFAHYRSLCVQLTGQYLFVKETIFSIALYLEHLQGQMDFQSNHKGLHSQAIRNEKLTDVSSGRFLWKSRGHKAQPASLELIRLHKLGRYSTR